MTIPPAVRNPSEAEPMGAPSEDNAEAAAQSAAGPSGDGHCGFTGAASATEAVVVTAEAVTGEGNTAHVRAAAFFLNFFFGGRSDPPPP